MPNKRRLQGPCETVERRKEQGVSDENKLVTQHQPWHEVNLLILRSAAPFPSSPIFFPSCSPPSLQFDTSPLLHPLGLRYETRGTGVGQAPMEHTKQQTATIWGLGFHLLICRRSLASLLQRIPCGK